MSKPVCQRCGQPYYKGGPSMGSPTGGLFKDYRHYEEAGCITALGRAVTKQARAMLTAARKRIASRPSQGRDREEG